MFHSLFRQSINLMVVLAVTSGVASAEKILLVGGQADAAQGDDSFVLEHLEDVLGHEVTYLTGDESSPDDTEGQDLLIISSTLGSGSVRGKFQDSEIPILQWEEALIRWDHPDPDGNFRMSQFSRNGQGRETTFINIAADAVGHPLAGGLEAGPHEIYEEASRTPQAFGELAPGLLRIAFIDEDFGEDDVSFWEGADGNEETGMELVLTAIDKDGELGPPDEGFFAPERRVNWPTEDVGFSFLNDTGLHLFNCSIDWLLGGSCVDTGPVGDFNGNGELDAGDLDDMATGMMMNDTAFDLNGDGNVNFDDRLAWIKDLRNTWVGDANLDGEFNSGDFVAVFQAGKFETGQPATWAEGDWDGDKVFGSGDFVAAFQDGGFELGPRMATNSVPEPSSVALLVLGVCGLAVSRRRS